MLLWAISDCFHINAVWCQRIEKEYLKYIFLAGFKEEHLPVKSDVIACSRFKSLSSCLLKQVSGKW